MAEKQKPEKQPEQPDERTEGEPLNERDAVSIKPTAENPIAPESQLPEGEPAPVGGKRYIVRRDALGRWGRGDEVTAEDLGGEGRVSVLLERGAIEEAA